MCECVMCMRFLLHTLKTTLRIIKFLVFRFIAGSLVIKLLSLFVMFRG